MPTGMELLMGHLSEKAGFNIAEMPQKIAEFQQGAQQVVQHFDAQLNAIQKQLTDVQETLNVLQKQVNGEEAHKGQGKK